MWSSFVLFTSLVALVVGNAPLYGYVDRSLEKQSFIVVFKKEIQESTRLTHVSHLNEDLAHVYDFGDFQGYAAMLNSTQLGAELASDDVAYIEVDQVVHTYDACSSQSGATWGINRVNQREIFLDGNYHYDSASGNGVYAFIVDTGIYSNHKDFGGRVEEGANFATGTSTEDCNGHGTHVAGTVGGQKYGIAKGTSLVPVRVLGCDGSGTNAGVIAGIQYVAKDRRRPAVANMSLGGGRSSAVNDAVGSAVRKGVTFVVAAGNENQNACNSSPASEPLAITVAATEVDSKRAQQEDVRGSFSNYGPCVDIAAPGVEITSDWIQNPEAILTISGTSMAAPHVAGAAVMYLAKNPQSSPAQVRDALLSSSTQGKIDLNCGSNSACNDTPNLLLFSDC